jgi:MFS family permease
MDSWTQARLQKIETPAALSIEDHSPSIVTMLAPIMATVFIGFLVIGAALPVLPLHVRDGLGFGPAMVGIVAGCQFAAALVARLWAGQAADTQGPKWAVIAGLAGAALTGLLYLSSLHFLGTPCISIMVLLAGRAVLGGAESFIFTGATTWGSPRRHPQRGEGDRVDGHGDVRGFRGRRAA